MPAARPSCLAAAGLAAVATGATAQPPPVDPLQWVLLRSDAECGSPDISIASTALGEPSVSACAARCAARSSCTYFVFGKVGLAGDKFGKCYQELTGADSCPEGWRPDSFDFYRLGAPPPPSPATPAPTASTGVFSAVLADSGAEGRLTRALARAARVSPVQVAVLRRVGDTLCVSVASAGPTACRRVLTLWFSVHGLLERERRATEALLLRPDTSREGELGSVLAAPLSAVTNPFRYVPGSGGSGARAVPAPSPAAAYRRVPAWAHAVAAACGAGALAAAIAVVVARGSPSPAAPRRLLPCVLATFVCSVAFGLWLLGSGLHYRHDYADEDGRWRNCSEGNRLWVWHVGMGALSAALGPSVAAPYAALWLREGEHAARRGVRLASAVAGAVAAACLAMWVYGSVLVWGAEEGDGCPAASSAEAEGCRGCGELRRLGVLYLVIVYVALGFVALIILLMTAFAAGPPALCRRVVEAGLDARAAPGTYCPPWRLVVLALGLVLGVWLLAAGAHFEDEYSGPAGRWRGCSQADALPLWFKRFGALLLVAAVLPPCASQTIIGEIFCLRVWLCFAVLFAVVMLGFYIQGNVIVWKAGEGADCPAPPAEDTECSDCGGLRSHGRVFLYVTYGLFGVLAFRTCCRRICLARD